MRFWKALTQLWHWYSSTTHRSAGQRRGLDSLDESELLEDRGVHNSLFLAAERPGRVRSADVLQVSQAQRFHHIARTRAAIVRLSVAAVDYLLEHEWVWLLTASRKRQSPGVPAGDPSDPANETNRTVSSSDQQWSVVAPVD